MNYVIVTTQWCEEHGVKVPEHARKSIDNTQVIFHEEFIKPVINAKETMQVYSHDSEELKEILNSKE